MRTFNRRQFNQGVGASLLLAPFASMLAPRPAHAATVKQAKRVLFFCTMGTHTPLWTPKVSGENITTFSDMTAPLAAVKDQIVLIEGMPSTNAGDGHGSPAGLCGRGNEYIAGPNFSAQPKVSADQFIADAMTKAGTAGAIPSLLLGADTSGGQTMLWKADQNVLPIASPASAFNTVFGGMMPAGSGGAAALLARRQSILDLVTSQIGTIQANVGAAEKAKLDLHLDSIRQLEKKLMASSSAPTACNMLAKPTDSTATHPAIANNLIHLDIIVNAFACDITRVAAIQFGTDQALQVDLPNLQGDQHNGFLHGSQTDFTKLVAFEAWLATQFAGLMTKMKARPAPDDATKTLLDDTLLVWARDMGEAATAHNMSSMRFVLGGSGYLKTNASGRYMDMSKAASGTTHMQVLLNAMEAMGVTDYTGYGSLSAGTRTPLPGVAA